MVIAFKQQFRLCFLWQTGKKGDDFSRNQSYYGTFQGFPSQESEWVGLANVLYHLK